MTRSVILMLAGSTRVAVDRFWRTNGRRFAIAVLLAVTVTSHHARSAEFGEFLASLQPEAEKLGVSRATFANAIRGLEPDLSLPDLVIPGRPEQPSRGQAEFVQTPAEYLRESSFDRLSAQGKKLLQEHRATLARIERQFGVPGPIVLALWGRETAFGGARLGHDAVRALATQAWTGRRKEFFRDQFLYVLKMLQDGIPRERLRSSWGGALGLTQLLPSEFYDYGVDFDGDGRVDIWNSVPDALAAAAKQLVVKGWERGKRWAIEVRAPKSMDCTVGVPEQTRTVAEWLRAGFAPAYGRSLTRDEMSESASLLQPAGLYGPSFLTPKNYFVIKEYNTSDLYVLFVGHLADRITDPRPFETPWGNVVQLKTADVERMQTRLADLKLYADKVDGKAGMKTRSAVGAYQKTNGLKVDCWPTTAVLEHMHVRR
jgi:lytic murein transglycosylase